MQVTIDPPIQQWLPRMRATPGGDAVIATGHQPWLWHPGILAKRFAVHAAAARFGCGMSYFVVDQDVHDALRLEQPRVEGDRLTVQRIELGEQRPDVPTGLHPPVKLATDQVRDPALRAALDGATGDTLAEQMTSAVTRLIEPFIGNIPVRYVSRLHEDETYRSFINDMVADARACAEAYNAALRETAVHDVAPLRIDADAVELPLWSCRWGAPRRRVYVAGKTPVESDRQPIDQESRVLPRAMTLSAATRSLYCALFIHGTGGRHYDRATEVWWRRWRGESLSPMAVVSADLMMDFAVPVADRAELARAVWRRHHLAHNMDPRKRELLDEMSATRNRVERAAIFHRMHQRNTEAAIANPEPLREAEHAVSRARSGITNAAIARKRDWCFALYPAERIAALRDTIAATADIIQP